MGETAKVALTLIGGVLLFCNIVALSTDGPSWALAITDAVAGAAVGLVYFMWSRFTEQGQDERLIAQGLATGEQPGKRKLMSRAFVYTVVAVGSLLTGLQGFINPEQGSGQGLGISSLLFAAAFGFLAFREHRRGRAESNPSLNSNPLAVLNAPPPSTTPTKAAPVGSPTTTLIVIAIFVILLTIADFRMILMPSGPNDVWIGVGQMVLWLPVFGYLAYREVRRMKAKPSHPEE